MTSPPATVHLVEDDEAVRDALAALLETAGLDVRAYASALEFLAAAHADPPRGCLVTDVQMPGMTGLELMHRLPALGIDLPAVVISARPEPAVAAAAMKAGARAFLSKPVDDQALLRAIFGAVGDPSSAA